jgi:nicotinamide mononucleotide transporter
MFDYEIHNENYIDMIVCIFFTGMWYMALKKIENWTLWIIGDLIVTPLYAYRGLGILSLQYLIFTILAISAYLEWKKILNSTKLTS